MFNLISLFIPIVVPNREYRERQEREFQQWIDTRPETHWPQETPQEQLFGTIIIFSYPIAMLLLIFAYINMREKKTLFSKFIFWIIPIVWLIEMACLIYWKNYYQ